MTFKSRFCSSPWFHMRINASGHYEYCRWATRENRHALGHIRDVTPEEFFQKNMAPLRVAMLAGQEIESCRLCTQMESHGKVSGRQKQLLKIGVHTENFEKTLASSPWLAELASSQDTGIIDLLPQDWQIDLGNHCNSACVFCTPESSSRLASEFVKLKLIDQAPPKSWTEDPVLVEKFVSTLARSPRLQYLHFLGGETLITPAFTEILQRLIDYGLNKNLTLGLTTNLTVWNDDTVNLLSQFESVHLGVSIECLHPVNDYVRWPSKLDAVTKCLDRWLAVVRENQWLMQIRTTPTVLTVSHLLSVYDWAWNNNVGVESCNFIDNPKFMRPSVLPLYLKLPVIENMKSWLSQKHHQQESLINIRHPDHVKTQLTQDLDSYIKYLENEPNQTDRLPDLVDYLKSLEQSRGNCILDYLPEYEEFFRSAGY